MGARRAVIAAAIVAASTAVAAAADVVDMRVEFLSDGRCAVNAEGAGYHASLTYLPPPGGSSDLRCTIPSPPKGRAINLSVTLPPGATPAGGEFPRVAWSERGSRWVGTVSLPAAPAFVRVPQPGPASPPRWVDGYAPATTGATFGWNFYGWFLVTAAFIACYFAWVRATVRRG
jgi:hypothetical protein